MTAKLAKYLHVSHCVANSLSARAWSLLCWGLMESEGASWHLLCQVQELLLGLLEGEVGEALAGS